MAGAPRLDEIERLAAAHLADGDAVGAQAQRRAHEVGERRRTVLGAQRHEVRRGALQLARVLDQNHPVVGLRDLGEQRVDQRGLAGRGAARHQDVGAGRDGLAQDLGLILGHDPGCNVVAQGKHRDGRSPDREGRAGNDRRQKTLKPLSRPGQFGRDTRTARMDFGPHMMRNETDDALAVCGREPLAGVLEPACETVNPESAIRVEHDLADAGVVEPAGNRGA